MEAVPTLESLAGRAHPVAAFVLRRGTGMTPQFLARLLYWVGPVDADPITIAGLLWRYILDPAAADDPTRSSTREGLIGTGKQLTPSQQLRWAASLLSQLSSAA